MSGARATRLERGLNINFMNISLKSLHPNLLRGVVLQGVVRSRWNLAGGVLWRVTRKQRRSEMRRFLARGEGNAVRHGHSNVAGGRSLVVVPHLFSA